MVIVEKSFPRGGIPASKDKAASVKNEGQVSTLFTQIYKWWFTYISLPPLLRFLEPSKGK